jgi:hypothetical protein
MPRKITPTKTKYKDLFPSHLTLVVGLPVSPNILTIKEGVHNTIVHHSSNCIQKRNNIQIHNLRRLERRKELVHKRYSIPVRVSVCPLYDAQRRSSSSNPSSSRSSSSFLRSTLSRKFFHSSVNKVNNEMSTSRDTKGQNKKNQHASQVKCYKREKITWVNFLQVEKDGNSILIWLF